MTTPEQLAKWREEFAKAFPDRLLSASHGVVNDNDYVFAGYLRRCQETEQAMKLAKFGAMVAKSHADGDFIQAEDLTTALLCSGSAVEPIKGKIDYATNIEATIKELLR